jgi:Wzt C-terminal domain
VYFGQPFRVTLTIEVEEPLRDAIVGLGISTLDGTRVASSFSTDGGGSPFQLARGSCRVAVDVDLTLLPRAYTLDCTIVRSDGYDIDTVNRVFDFAALDAAESGSDSYRWSTVRGFVRPLTRWHEPERAPEDRPFHAVERT